MPTRQSSTPRTRRPDRHLAAKTKELLLEHIAKLEAQMMHLSDKLDDSHKNVEEMHAILLQAKGAAELADVAGFVTPGEGPTSLVFFRHS
jgi:hypothetical protein